ncbi:MAG: GNAT family N-acetyltransferase [Mongoliitalea sp.]
MAIYKVLNKQVFSAGNFSIVPIRSEDRYAIMKWRNEQLYHLRQDRPLTKADQDAYFENVVSKLFDEEKPKQILFSYLDGEKCIGYGGLVHINWTDKNAEISFIMDTALEKDFFSSHWKTYLALIEKVAFNELKLHKIFTYAFDLRPHLYEALEGRGYEGEARLKEHCFFEGKFIDVLIHSKTSDSLYLRDVVIEDVHITYTWANDPNTRKYAFNQGIIPLEDHQNWFSRKMNDQNCIYQLFEKGSETLGSIRFDVNGQEGLISYLIEPDQTGKGYGTKMLDLAVRNIETRRPDIKMLKGLVKKENLGSKKIFEKLGFERKDLNNGVIEYTLNMNHADRKL